MLFADDAGVVVICCNIHTFYVIDVVGVVDADVVVRGVVVIACAGVVVVVLPLLSLLLLLSVRLVVMLLLVLLLLSCVRYVVVVVIRGCRLSQLLSLCVDALDVFGDVSVGVVTLGLLVSLSMVSLHISLLL